MKRYSMFPMSTSPYISFEVPYDQLIEEDRADANARFKGTKTIGKKMEDYVYLCNEDGGLIGRKAIENTIKNYRVVAKVIIETNSFQIGKEFQAAINRQKDLKSFLERHKEDIEASVCSPLDTLKPIEVEIEEI